MTYSVVFLGPSLERSRAQRTLDATFLPPIKRGDIDELLKAKAPVAIGIIDGQFFQSLAISPKEVLRALDAGVRVFGASSMGALRAAELAPFGMVGIGDVYRLYADGVIDADDEVALTYDDDGLEPLSVPLVNMRLALRAATARGLTTAEFAEDFIAAASALYFPDRTYSRVFKALGSKPAGPLRLFLSQHDAKRDDAIGLLTMMRDYLPPPAAALTSR